MTTDYLLFVDCWTCCMATFSVHSLPHPESHFIPSQAPSESFPACPLAPSAKFHFPSPHSHCHSHVMLPQCLYTPTHLHNTFSVLSCSPESDSRYATQCVSKSLSCLAPLQPKSKIDLRGQGMHTRQIKHHDFCLH